MCILSGTATVLLSYSALADPCTVILAFFQPYKDRAIINGTLAGNDLVYRSTNIRCSGLHYSGCTLRIAILLYHHLMKWDTVHTIAANMVDIYTQ